MITLISKLLLTFGLNCPRVSYMETAPTVTGQPEWQPTLDRVWWWHELPITEDMERLAAKLHSDNIFSHLTLVAFMEKVEG